MLGPDGLVWRFNTFCFGRLPKSSELRELLEKLDVDPLWRVGEYPPSLFRDAESAASREFDQSRLAQISSPSALDWRTSSGAPTGAALNALRRSKQTCQRASRPHLRFASRQSTTVEGPEALDFENPECSSVRPTLLRARSHITLTPPPRRTLAPRRRVSRRTSPAPRRCSRHTPDAARRPP